MKATFFACFVMLVIGQVQAATSGSAVDAARVKVLAGLLAPRPAALAPSITERKEWDRIAKFPESHEFVKAARNTMAVKLPESPDSLYLDFSKTGNRDRWQAVASRRRARIADFTIAECLENRGQFIPVLETTIREICAERTWVMPAHDRKLDNFEKRIVEMDLGATMLAWEMGSCLAIMGEKLSPPVRQLIKENLQTRIFTPFRKMVEGRQGQYWLNVENNWNAVCLGGVIGCALASLDSAEERAFHVVAAEHFVKNFLNGFTPDGYCSEGMGYWNYGFGYFVMMSEAVRRATDGKVEFLADPKACAPAHFGLRAEVINGVYPPIADCSPGSSPDPSMMYYLCHRFDMHSPVCDRPLKSGPHHSLYGTGMYCFLPEKLPVIPAMLSAGADESPLRTWFKDAGILICRPSAKGVPFAAVLKGGHNAEHHNHNDVGAFMVVLTNSMVLTDPGAEVYTARTFSAQRYDSDVLNSFGHAVPVVAGKMQSPGAQFRARVIKTEFSADADTYILDLRGAYAVPGLQRLERTFVFRRAPSPSLLVTDVVEYDQPQTYETAIVTWGKEKNAGKNEWLLGDKGCAVRVKVDAGDMKYKMTSTTLTANVRAKSQPRRIGFALDGKVKTATVVMTITPEK